MRIFVPLIAGLLVVVPGLLSAAERGGKGTAGDRPRLIEGVHEIAAPGAPGSLAVFAPMAHPIVVGKADGDHRATVVASGYLGRGKVVAFAHDGYFHKEALETADTAQLLRNAARWATPSKSPPMIGVVGLPQLRDVFARDGWGVAPADLDGDLSPFQVLALTPYRFPTPAQGAKVRAFAEAGGGLLLAATGWGWQQGSHLPMAEFPGNLLLNGSGIAWTNGFAGKTTANGFSADEEPMPLVHAERALDRLSATSGGKPTPKETGQATASILLTLRNVPPSEPHFRARLRQVLRSSGVSDEVPTRPNPVRAQDPLRRLAVAWETESAREAPPEKVHALPAAADFPGSVPKSAPRGKHAVAIDPAVPGWHSLGLYAAPGEKMTVRVPDEAVALKLSVRIGAHTDELWHLDAWQRVPALSRVFPIKENATVVANALGGLIYLDVPDRASAHSFPVTVSGAVEAPFFERGETSLADWKKTIRQRPAPWAELAGKSVIFTVPSDAVRSLDDPESLLALWDAIVAAQDEIVSLPPRTRPERIVADRQISAGYMHSGYPIMVPIDGSLALALNETRLRAEGSWGHFHELGHNHQSGDWTFAGTGEVTNNVLVLYVFDQVLKLRYDSGHEAIRDRAKRAQRIRDFQARGAPFSEWQSDPFLALMMYMQLYEGFGWEPFRKVFAEYRNLPASERPKSDDAKRDQWLTRFSKAVGKNLGPFFEAWGVPTSEAARESIKDLPSWMPAEPAKLETSR